ncbi:MAG: hypothetical protein MPEBLZ_04084 [Candidatus Methanoperedens nitroreducens]|uniref:Uncharacterized protein n=1 Tax=Candidatus Methanoperedens nitratireducens TaxID=1392998 RepID=A0A0P8C463_9EURY|nr:hypothetical protein [Candidatus Methanoperedens sp. BLZ2]KAB2945524.1 MAG: hypothetical protein F9K14_10875 [Candidatus Methanoperedens sp.]KPQ41375.1 MAG: hypothetical protein MPEBLZ_04084 [Candidatus Methanoperedens sp. BLZ1]MBZ0174775.1 hypothetical protein [Candidatus Methanoperedens nitroreducens]MCX9080120.1 hypothetical protein [Candidatus Methanoperedens sp.]
MTPDNFLDNDSAAEGLPMRLVVTVILLSVIIGLSAKAVYLFIDNANEKKLKGQLDLIDKRASLIYIQGGAQDIDDPADFSGTVENIHVEIPDNAAFVVFGGMPTTDGNVSPPESGNLHTDNVFYYVLNDGRVQTRSSIARFSSNTTGLDRPFVLYPGEYDLTMELVKNKNGTYVKIE